MKILINEKQLNFLVEQTKENGEKIYNRPGDPYEYKNVNGTWFSRKKGTTGNFIDITKYQKSIDILNKEFPQSKIEDPKAQPTNQTQSVEPQSKSVDLKTDKEFNNKLTKISQNLGINPQWLKKVIRKESQFNPTIQNNIGCVGLIQFCPDTKRGSTKKIGDKTYNLADIKNMSGLQQLDLVEKFYEPYKGKLNSYHDLYLVTFYPAAVGKGDNYVFGKTPEYQKKLSTQNPAIAIAAGKEPGTPLTVSDFKMYTSAS